MTKILGLTSALTSALPVLVTLSLFSSCAFDSTDKISDQNRRYNDDREALMKVYSPVLGTYSGELVLKDHGSQDQIIAAKMILFTQEQTAGNDPSGQILLKPVLKATFVRNDAIEKEHILTSRYDEKTGQFLLANSSASSRDDVESVEGILLNNTIEATLKLHNGGVGQLRLQKVDQDSNNALGSQIALNENILKEYKLVEGFYEATVKPSSTQFPTLPAPKPFVLQLNLRTIPMANGRPVILGYYDRPDLNGVLSVQELKVQYHREAYTKKLILSPATTGSGSFIVNISGNFFEEQIDASGNTTPAYIDATITMLRGITSKTRFVRVKNQ